MTGYDGKGKGFGFVSFEEPEAAERVGTAKKQNFVIFRASIRCIF